MENNKTNLISISKLTNTVKNITPAKSKEDYLYLETSGIKENIITNYLHDTPQKINDLPGRARQPVSHNNILFSGVRPKNRHFGVIKNPPDNLLSSTGFIHLIPNEDLVYSNYIYYFLTHEKVLKRLNSIANASQSSYPSINPIHVLELELPNIPKSKQLELFKNFEAIDEIIFNNLLMIENLESLIQKLFFSWFIAFDQNNCTGVIKEENQLKIMESLNFKNFSAKWEKVKIGKFIEFSKESIEFDNSSETLVDLYSLDAFSKNDKRPEVVTEASIDSLKYVLEGEYFLISKLLNHKKSKYPIKIWRPHSRSPRRAVSSSEFLVVKQKNGKVNLLQYLWNFFQQEEFKKVLFNQRTGGNHKRISPDFINNLEIFLPTDLEALEEFNNISKTFEILINSKLSMNDDLAVYKSLRIEQIFNELIQS